jgi:hypothetical protein
LAEPCCIEPVIVALRSPMVIDELGNAVKQTPRCTGRRS